ncbi:MAG: BamA/TamA family outer membrane protein [Candidatus Zixiibacteriota bacterium]
MVRAFLIFFTLLNYASSDASKIPVRVVGSDAAIRDEIDRYLRTLSPSAMPDSMLTDSVQSWLVGQGYLEAQVATTADTLAINPGACFQLECVRVSNDTLAICELARPFTRENLESAIDSVLDHFRSQGHYYARASVDSVDMYHLGVTVVLNLTPGPVVTVSDIHYEGLTRSRPSLIDRYVSVRAGDTITDDYIRHSEARASRAPFVGFEPPVTVRPRAGYNQADLTLHFRERPQVSLFGGLAYQPDDDRRVLFNLDMTLRNLFGDGRLVSFLADHRDANRNTLHLVYGQPLFLAGIGWLNAGVQSRDYRDQFYELGALVGYTAQSGEALSLGFDLGFKRVEPSLGPNRYRRYAAGLTLTRAGFDDPQNPSRGLNLRSSVSYAFRRYTDDSANIVGGPNFSETHASFEADMVQPLWGGMVGRVVLAYRGFETSESLPPMSELQFVGGPGTLRGYRTEQFAVQRTALATLEPRYRFAAGHLFTFIDFAYLNRPTANGTEELFRYGYGIGFGARDLTRSIRISLGWNPDVRFDQPRLSVDLATDL